MKANPKNNPTLTICLTLLQTSMLLSSILLQSCIMTTVVKDIEDTVDTRKETTTSKAATLKEGLLTIQIQNNTENTILLTDRVEICNIQLAYTTGEVAHKGSLTYSGSIELINDTLQLHYGTNTSTPQVKIPIQTLTPWNTTEHPTTSKNTYAKIHGTLYSYLTNNTPYPVYTGTMYYPITGKITDTTTITITIQPNCPLYATNNGKLEKILQPITFSITVEDWE